MKHPIVFFFALSLLLIQVLIFFPIITWTQNQFNLDTPLIEGVALLITILGALVGLVAITAWLIPSLLRNFLLPILVVSTVLIFFQQNILVGEYGMIDGKTLEFNDVGYLTWFDSILWCTGLLLSIIWRKFISQKAALILTFSGLASVAVLITALISYDFKSNQSNYSISEQNKFNFSDQENALVFLLDAFQSDLFTQIIDAEPALKKHFSGFKYYPNTTAVFSKTYPTIPLLFSGKVYSKKQPIKEFLVSAYQKSLLTDLIDADWHVAVYPYNKQLLPINPNIMTNVTNDYGWTEIVADYFQTLDLSLLRSVPHTLKPKVFNNGEFVVRKPVTNYIKQKKWFKNNASNLHKLPRIDEHVGVNFLSQLKVHADTSLPQPSFKFYHLIMPHSPFLLDRNLNPTPHKNETTAYHDYAYASIKLMIQYLVELKKLGVYDKSSIMILADHGGGVYHDLAYDANEKSFIPIKQYGREKASAKPLLLIKEMYNNDPFSISQSPASLLDVMPTLAALTGMKAESAGIPINQLTETQTRVRTYYYYEFTGFDSKFLQDFNTFKISGHVNEDSSWEHSGILTTAEDSTLQNNELYQLNQIAGFGTDIKHNSHHTNRFLVNDNHVFHSSKIESTAQAIELEVPLTETLEARSVYQLYLSLSSVNSSHSVSIIINDVEHSVLNLDERLTEHQIPFVLHSNDEALLKIKIKNINSNETTPLGLSRLVIKKIHIIEPHRVDDTFQFDLTTKLNHYHLNGFWPVEKWGRWTSKKQASLLFLQPKGFCQNNTVKLSLQKFHTGVDPEQFKVTMNQVPLTFNSEKSTSQILYYTFDCPLAKNQINNLVQFNIQTNTIVSPSEISQSRDRRKLGVAIKSIEFNNLEQ